MAFDAVTESSNSERFHDETVELLRSEVSQLERELAERDATIAELSARASSGEYQIDHDADVAPDTAALVSRLEQLLDELERKDQREASLQEMLRVAEDANRAEQEERHQIESWLGEIEQRIGQREAEWQAANDELRQQIEKVTQERDRAETAITGKATGQDSSEISHAVLTDLRHQIAELQRKLGDKEKDVSTLNEQLAQAQSAASATPAKESIDQTLRAERLQVAHERAELARQRAELEHDRRGLNRGPSEIDQRVQALRDHLKEIHERQVQEQKVRHEQSLAGRIAKLWKRLDGSD